MNHSGVCFIALLVGIGCANPTEPLPRVEKVVRAGQVVSVFDATVGVPDATLTGAEVSAHTDGSGRFRFEAEPESLHTLDISHPGFITRRSTLRASGTDVTLSLIPRDFNLASFNQFARDPIAHATSGSFVIRWTGLPRLVIDTSIYHCTPACRATAEQATAGELAALEASLHEAINKMSQGSLRFAGVTYLTAVPGSLHQGETLGAISVMLAGNLWELRAGGIAFTKHSAAVITSAGVRLDRQSFNDPFFRTRLVGHETGHALGYGHVTSGAVSIMSSGCAACASSDVSAFDRQAIAVINDRPPGNMSPDVDPPGFSSVSRPTSISSSTPKLLLWSCPAHGS